MSERELKEKAKAKAKKVSGNVREGRLFLSLVGRCRGNIILQLSALTPSVPHMYVHCENRCDCAFYLVRESERRKGDAVKRDEEKLRMAKGERR